MTNDSEKTTRAKKSCFIIILFLVVIILLVGGFFLFSNNTYKTIREDQYIDPKTGTLVETTPDVEPIGKDSPINRMTNVERYEFLSMRSCFDVKHQIADDDVDNINAKHYDSSNIILLCSQTKVSDEINTTISFRRPCEHAFSGSIALCFDPPIDDFVTGGHPLDVVCITFDNLNENGMIERTDDIFFDRFYDNYSKKNIVVKQGEIITVSIVIKSDGKQHTVTPHYYCGSGHFMFKADEFIGRPEIIK